MKTLIVDAHPRTRDLLREMVEGRGKEAILCENIPQAKELYPNDPCILIIVDCDDPMLNWREFCRWVRGQTFGSQHLILGTLTFPPRARNLQSLLEAGINDYLPKPYDPVVLDARLAIAERHLQERIEQQRTQELVNTRAQQQVALAALGQFALSDVDVPTMSELVTTFVVQTLDVESSEIYELLLDRSRLILRAKFGGKDPNEAQLELPVTADSLAGLTLVSKEPVMIPDLSANTRFARLQGLQDRGMLSAVGMPIQGKGGSLGVLEAHSMKTRTFTSEELYFLQGLANVLGAAIDRKNSETEIRKLAEFPRRNPNPVFELTEQGELAYCNDASQRAAKAMGKDHAKDMLPSDFQEVIAECLRTGESCIDHQSNAGDRKLSCYFFPIQASRTVHCYAEDITERSALETQLRQLQKMESVGQLAAGVAHDFNNILTVIQGHASFLMLDKGIGEKKADSLNRILGAVEHASRLTRQLLAFSRKQVLQPKECDLNEVIATDINMLGRMLGEHITLDFKPMSSLPAVLADPSMLEQIIMNLAINARDAMPGGGRLTLSTSLLEIDEAHVQRHSEARTGTFVCLQIDDTGTGIPPDVMGRLFEPFFTTKPSGRGTGLGLATVYGVVKQHEGWIEVHSQVGHGTSFLVFLPSLGKSLPPNPASAPGKTLSGGAETILLVEDDARLIELGRIVLQTFGYRLLTARTGLEALQVWAEHGATIALLLTDMVLPDGLMGWDLASRLRKNNPSLKVMFTSGYHADPGGKPFAGQEGSVFLEKPYNIQRLVQMVRDCLDQDQPASMAGNAPPQTGGNASHH